MASNTRGILMFAHNNQEIDYFRMAIINSLLIQKHLGLTSEQITIVTDASTYEYGVSQFGEEKIEEACVNFIISETDLKFKHNNQRTFKDTYYNPKMLPFYNVNRADAYQLSPYDETIVIDVDYLIFSDSLNHCWGHSNDLMMNWEFNDVLDCRKFDELDRLNPLGISMYWATVVYFKKTAESETFFNLVKHVRSNREYYSSLYKFNNGVYRNDFSFSIAAHMLYGFQDKGLPQLPVKLFKTFDNDDVHKVKGDQLYLYVEKPRSPGDFVLVKWKGIDIHIMNKWAVNRISEHLLYIAQNDVADDYEISLEDQELDSKLKENLPDLDTLSTDSASKPKFNDVKDAIAAFKAMQEAKKAHNLGTK